MTRRKALGTIQVELIRGKDIRPKTEEHHTELLYVTDMDAYQEKKYIFDTTVFDNDTVDINDGVYYIKDVWTSVLLSAAEVCEFHNKYGDNPTGAQKKNLRIPVVLIKFDVRNGALFIGEGDNFDNKIRISAQMLIDHQE